MQYGRAIRIVRAARALSQGQLASAAKLTPSYISLLEADKRNPTLSVLNSIAKALDVPLHLLILFASDEKDLRGITPEQAKALGVNFLELIGETSSPPRRQQSKGRRPRRVRKP